MGPLSTALLIAAFEGLKWLFGLTAALLALLTAVQAVRGDEGARPAATIALGLVFLAAALACGWIGRRIEAAARRGPER